MFLHVSVILSTGVGGVVSQHALQVVSQHALQVSRGGLQAHTQGGKLRGLARASRPTPSGEVEGSGHGGLQAHTQGGSRPTPRGMVSRPTPRGSPGPHPGGSPGPHPGGSPGPHPVGLQAHTWGCIPACTEADPAWMATAAGGKHPAGMHSFSLV